jgi:MscS family membrane protein
MSDSSFGCFLVDRISALLPESWSEPVIITRAPVQWAAAIIVILAAFALGKPFAKLIVQILANIRWQGERLGTTRFARLIPTLKWILPLFGLRYALVCALNLSADAGRALDILLQIFLIVIILLLADTVLQLLFRWLELRNPKKMTETVQLFYLQILRIFLVILGIIMVLSLFGLNVSGIVTGLGIGGLAVSLAAKDTLTNLFAGLTIMTDKMFELGDIISGPEFEGTVEYIGLRSSRVRSFEQTELIIPNAKLTDNVLVNLSNMKKRRLRLQISLPVDISLEQIDKLKMKLEEFVQSREQKSEDQPYIALESLADNSLVLFFQFYIKSLDYDVFVQERDAVLSFIWQFLKEEDLKLPWSKIQIFPDGKTSPKNTPS